MQSHTFIRSVALLGAALCFGAGAWAGQSSHSSDTPATPSDTSSSNGKLKFLDKRFIVKTAESGQLEIALAQLAVERASNSEVRSFAQQLVSDHHQMSRQLEELAARKGLQSEIAEYKSHMGGSMAMDRRASSRSGSSTASTGASAPATTPASATDSDPKGYHAPGTASTVAENDDSRRSTATAATATTPSPGDIADAGAPTGRSSDMNEWNDPTKDRHYRRLAGKSGAEFDAAFIDAMVSDHEDEVTQFDKKAQKADDADVRSFAAASLPKLREHLAHAQQLSAQVKTSR